MPAGTARLAKQTARWSCCGHAQEWPSTCRVYCSRSSVRAFQANLDIMISWTGTSNEPGKPSFGMSRKSRLRWPVLKACQQRGMLTVLQLLIALQTAHFEICSPVSCFGKRHLLRRWYCLGAIFRQSVSQLGRHDMRCWARCSVGYYFNLDNFQVGQELDFLRNRSCVQHCQLEQEFKAKHQLKLQHCWEIQKMM